MEISNLTFNEYIGVESTVAKAKIGALREHYNVEMYNYDKYNLEDVNSKTHLHIAEVFLTLGLCTSSMILDFGPGTGSLGKILHKAGYENLHTMDLSPEVLAICKSLDKVYKRFIPHYVQLNKPLPLKPRTYDVLLLSSVFCPWAFGFSELKHIMTLVKRGGVVGFNLFLDNYSGMLDANFTNAGIMRNAEELVTSGLVQPIPGFYPKIFDNHWNWKPGAVFFAYVV